MRKNLYSKTQTRVFLILICGICCLINLTSCKRDNSNEESTTTTTTVTLPAPPDFQISEAICTAALAPPVIYAFYSTFTLTSNNLTNILQCAAWGTPDVAPLIGPVGPCVLYNGPAILSPDIPKVEFVEVDCLASDDLTGNALIVFVTCIDYVTGLSTTKKVTTDICT